MIAAVIGGGIVLYGSDDIARYAGQLGLPQPSGAKLPADAAQRIAALETQVAAPQTPALPDDVSARLSQIEAQSAKIAELGQRVAALSTAQDKLQADVAKAPAATGAASGDLEKRLASLEQTLDTLQRSAGSNGASGSSLAQVAALAGKLSDLEETLKTRIASLRENVQTDIDQRLAPTAQASEAARSGTQRVDRELAETKNEVARIAQRTEALGATADRLDKSVRAVSEEAGKLADAVSTVRGDLESKIAAVAKPEDVRKAVAPVEEKITALQGDLGRIVESESERKANAERVVLALQLASLKRALDRGTAFADELQAVKQTAGGQIDVSALEPYKSSGVPTAERLLSQLRGMSHDLIAAGEPKADQGWVDQMLSGARNIVRIRKTGEAATSADPASPEAVVARIEQSLQQGDMAAAADAAAKLPPTAKASAQGWLKQLDARAQVERAMASIERDLKASLAGDGSNGKKS